MKPPHLASTNIPLQGVTTNLSRFITEEEATEVAKQEALRRGRTKMKVRERWFERGEWNIGLSFEPYDEVGSSAVVCVTTNGVVRQYIRGR